MMPKPSRPVDEVVCAVNRVDDPRGFVGLQALDDTGAIVCRLFTDDMRIEDLPESGCQFTF